MDGGMKATDGTGPESVAARPALRDADLPAVVVPGSRRAATRLEDQIAGVGRRLMRAVEACVTGLEAGPGPIALSRRLGIDKVLASRVLKALRADDPLSGISLMPGPDPLRRLVQSAARSLPPERVVDALEAIDAFESLIRDGVGDRSLLDTIVSAWVPEARREFELRRKQAMFKAVSQLRGVQADVLAATVIVTPSAVPNRLDVVWVNILSGVQRLRPGAVIKIMTRRMDPAAHPGPAERAPTTIDGRALTPEEPDALLRSLLLEDFCSQPLPALQVRRVRDVVFYTLADEGLGARSAVDVRFAEVNRGELDRYVPRGSGRKGYFFIDDTVPAVKLQFDLLVHRDLYPSVSAVVGSATGSSGSLSLLAGLPELSIYDTAFDGPASVNNPVRDIDRYDVLEAVEPLGQFPPQIRSPSVRRYSDTIAHVLARTGVEPESLRGWRTAIDYPIYGSQVTLAMPAEESPA